MCFVGPGGITGNNSVEFSMNCDTYYYGRNCDVFCLPRRDNRYKNSVIQALLFSVVFKLL